MQLNFDVFDHQMKVKVAETFWGTPAPQASHLGGLRLPQPPQCGTQKTHRSTK